jgi:hypothetical protein
VITQLERWALKAQGLLTEEEFAAQKAKLLWHRSAARVLSGEHAHAESGSASAAPRQKLLVS